MSPHVLCAVLSLAVALLGATARGDEVARGGALYVQCATCHGAKAEGNRAVQAPALAGLPEEYVAQQLRNFRGGRRGTVELDVYGAQMARMAEQLWDEREVRSVASYIAALRPVTTGPTLRGGKPSRGKKAYTACAACHGPDGAGNMELGAPPVAGRDDWYLASQLAAFRSGMRGAHADDPAGQVMRAAAATLGDEQAVLDVAAYLASLRSAATADRRR